MSRRSRQRFHQLRPGIWATKPFCDMPDCLRSTYMHLLHHHRATAVPGLLQGTLSTLAEHSGVVDKTFGMRLRRLKRADFVAWDERKGSVYSPRLLPFSCKPATSGYHIRWLEDALTLDSKPLREQALSDILHLLGDWDYSSWSGWPAGWVPGCPTPCLTPCPPIDHRGEIRENIQSGRPVDNSGPGVGHAHTPEAEHLGERGQEVAQRVFQIAHAKRKRLF